MQIYYQMGTRNTSFLKMHEFLQATGIKNNKFMLSLFDPDLAGVDPYDPSLSLEMKMKINVLHVKIIMKSTNKL